MGLRGLGNRQSGVLIIRGVCLRRPTDRRLSDGRGSRRWRVVAARGVRAWPKLTQEAPAVLAELGREDPCLALGAFVDRPRLGRTDGGELRVPARLVATTPAAWWQAAEHHGLALRPSGGSPQAAQRVVSPTLRDGTVSVLRACLGTGGHLCADRSNEDGHVLAAAHPTEGAFCLEHPGADPPAHHRRIAPVLHPAREVADYRDHRLDDVRAAHRARQAAGDARSFTTVAFSVSPPHSPPGTSVPSIVTPSATTQQHFAKTTPSMMSTPRDRGARVAAGDCLELLLDRVRDEAVTPRRHACGHPPEGDLGHGVCRGDHP